MLDPGKRWLRGEKVVHGLTTDARVLGDLGFRNARLIGGADGGLQLGSRFLAASDSSLTFQTRKAHSLHGFVECLKIGCHREPPSDDGVNTVYTTRQVAVHPSMRGTA